MKVAVIGGTGRLGRGLAARWAATGIEVIIGSRKKEKAEKAAEILSDLTGMRISGYVNREAAEKAETIVLTIPYKGIKEILESIFDELYGKSVISTIVSPNPSRYDSAAMLVRKILPSNSSLASAFQNISAEKLHNLSEPVKADVIVCGEPAAKEKAVKLAERIDGVRAFDGGELENAWILEALTHLIIDLNKRYKRRGISIRFTGI